MGKPEVKIYTAAEAFNEAHEGGLRAVKTSKEVGEDVRESQDACLGAASENSISGGTSDADVLPESGEEESDPRGR